MDRVRPPAVAGTFYPSRKEVLMATLEEYLESAGPAKRDKLFPKAVIVPHAGYAYSGPIAASAYRLLSYHAEKYSKVVLLGPSHRVYISGLALPRCEFFSTPLGWVELDGENMQMLAELSQVQMSDEAHAYEHSLEVQLPFLQKILPQFSLTALSVGDATPGEIADVLDRVWGGPETLIVVSSDLSHYLPYETAKRVDAITAQAILECNVPITHDQACGGSPVNGLLVAARHHQIFPELLDLRNSGDTSGARDRVVGYGSFVFWPGEEHDKA